MSLRAKYLPKKSSLQSSATKQTTFTTTVKRTTSNYLLGREKNLSIASMRSQLTKTRSAKYIATKRNVRTLLKCTTRPATIFRKKDNILSKEEQGVTTKVKKRKTKIRTHLDQEKTSSSINCSRSGRRLVPARCACANDSVTARCSIHNNFRASQSSNSTESNSPATFLKSAEKKKHDTSR